MYPAVELPDHRSTNWECHGPPTRVVTVGSVRQGLYSARLQIDPDVLVHGAALLQILASGMDGIVLPVANVPSYERRRIQRFP